MEDNARDVIRILMNFGKASHMLDELLEDDVLQAHFLSKHNTYFYSENEDTAEKLAHLRTKLLMISDQIHEILYAINIEE